MTSENSKMSKATYNLLDGSKLTVDYDPSAPCRICGLPVVTASVGGTNVCPWCDCGYYRDGSEITYQDLVRPERIKARAKVIQKMLVEADDAESD